VARQLKLSGAKREPGAQPRNPRDDYVAVLLLHDGESSSNGKVGVRVTNILEAEPCGDVFSEYHRRATVQFFNPANGQQFCEVLATDKGNARIPCADKVGADTIGVREISTAEKWVLFDLRY
jgi:hypothetical protein